MYIYIYMYVYVHKYVYIHINVYISRLLLVYEDVHFEVLRGRFARCLMPCATTPTEGDLHFI